MKWPCGLTLFLLTFFSLVGQGSAYADGLALSSISFSSLQITPMSGSLVFGGPWAAQGFAQAENSLGDLSAQFDSSSASAMANASVTLASASVGANAGDLTGVASGGVNLTGIPALSFGASVAQGTLSNVFTITGGVGSTSVSFSTQVTGLLRLAGDAATIETSTEAIFNLTLNSDSVLFFDSALTGGPNFNVIAPFTQALSTTVMLDFDKPYFVLAQADSESRAASAAIPEPSTLPMMLVGLVLVAGAARQNIVRRHTK